MPYPFERSKNKHWLPWLNLAARRGIINRFQQVELILSWELKMTLTVESFELAKALFGLVAAMWVKAGRPWWAATNFPCAEFEVMFIQGFQRAATGSCIYKTSFNGSVSLNKLKECGECEIMFHPELGLY